jgi:endonuclease/exonuclease/phosphatase family metal-dependent hydrolase
MFSLPRRCLFAALMLTGPLLALFLSAPPSEAAPGRNYLFCFWNVENFFDDRVDGWKREPDKEYDTWFGTDKAALAQKLDNLCKVLLEMNGGRGPDILALAEVESYRAAELLQQALNSRLRNKADHYPTVQWKDPSGGRSIACALITRLKINADRSRLLGKRQRILEVHVEAEGRDLVVIASHWTSRITDRTGTGRAKYADQIYGRYKAIYKANPKVDLLVCGDFNDTPSDDSVTKHLHATADWKRVKAGGAKPLLFAPFADLASKGQGSHYYGGRAYVFDHVCLSPGLLDNAGWSYVEGSARIVPKIAFRGRPDRFGGPRDKRPLKARGASDHFPVTVELRVQR